MVGYSQTEKYFPTHSFKNSRGSSFSGAYQRSTSAGSVDEMSLFERYLYSGKRRKSKANKLKMVTTAIVVWWTSH